MNEYKKLADTFTAEDFDAEEIAKTAKAAGCKYITLTTRHHEGFSLYDTCGLNDFDAPHTPAGRDLIREFVDACNKYGLMPMFYHTTLDWYNPDFDENFDEYLEYLRKSVETLCKNYGRPCGVAGIGKNFALKSTDGKSLYLFVYDLAIKGDDNVTVGGKYRGAYAFGGVQDEIESVKWMDNDEELSFVQGDNMLAVDFTGQPYGKSYPVRVAKAVIK